MKCKLWDMKWDIFENSVCKSKTLHPSKESLPQIEYKETKL